MKVYQKKNRAYFVGAWLSVLFSTIFAVVLQFFKGGVLDAAVAGESRTAVRCALLLALFILGENLFYFVYKKFCARYVTGCTRLLKRDVFESILRRSYVDYKERPQGEYVAKYTSEADAIRSRRFGILPLFWEILLKILFVSAALFLLDWRVAVLTLALLTTPLYVPKLIEKRLQTTQSDYLRAVEEHLSQVNDWLAGFEIIKNFSVEKKILERFQGSCDTSMEALRRDMELGAVSQLISALISYLSYFAVLLCSAWLVLRGDFSAGDFFVAIGMIDQLSYPLISLADIIRLMLSIKPACAAMEEFIAAPGGGAEERELTELREEIRFSKVRFAYPGGEPVLRDFDLTVRKGERYLLRGPSGCGKTTAVNLLLRYYDADGGAITVDGAPIGQVGDPYGCMTVVRQEAVLFHDSLRNNLTMYRPVPDGKLTDLLRRLGLEKFANTQALDQIITEGGANLSGGEKKRVCLARALLRDTDVLILDEPLANLDEDTARKIEDLLLSIRDRTLLVVSHQFSEEKLAAFREVVTFGAKA